MGQIIISERNSHVYGQVFLDKIVEVIPGRKSVLNKWYWENLTSMCRSMKQDSNLKAPIKSTQMITSFNRGKYGKIQV